MKDRAEWIVRLGRALRAAGVGTVLRDELDAAEALGHVDDADREEARRALLTALKITPRAFAIFDRLFDSLWSGNEPRVASGRPSVEAPRVPPGPALSWDPDRRRMAIGEAPGASGEGDRPGYSPEALLRRRGFDEVSSPADRAEMERLLARLARRLATRPSRRLVPTAGRGRPDLRRSLRGALRTDGELVGLARRTRAVEEPRLVFLCDASGSMDPHSRFLLSFVLSLGRAARRAEVFVFSTELVRVTPWLAGRQVERVLDRLAEAVPDWSGGTRIGDCLSRFADEHGGCLDGKTVVVILSDGLDRGDAGRLAGALRWIRSRVRKVIWLNPLLADERYRPDAGGMQAALPFVDHFAAAYSVESLERVLPHLAA